MLLGQEEAFYLKETGSDNYKETKLPVSYLVIDCEELARGNCIMGKQNYFEDSNKISKKRRT